MKEHGGKPAALLPALGRRPPNPNKRRFLVTAKAGFVSNFPLPRGRLFVRVYAPRLALTGLLTVRLPAFHVAAQVSTGLQEHGSQERCYPRLYVACSRQLALFPSKSNRPVNELDNRLANGDSGQATGSGERAIKVSHSFTP